MAVVIDGEIFQDAYLAPLNHDSEIFLIPKIGGAELRRKICAAELDRTLEKRAAKEQLSVDRRINLIIPSLVSAGAPSPLPNS